MMITRDEIGPKRNLFGAVAGQTSPRGGKRNKKSPQKSPLKVGKSRQSLGRSAKSRQPERIDLTRLSTAQYDDLLAGVNLDGEEENSRSREQKKKDAAQKQAAEDHLSQKVQNMSNIYSKNNFGSTKEAQESLTEGVSTSKNLRDSSAPSGAGTVIVLENLGSLSPAHSANDQENPAAEGENDCESPSGSVSLNSGVQLDKKKEDETILDSTLLLSCSSETQTDEYICEKCTTLYADLESVLVKHITAYGEQAKKSKATNASCSAQGHTGTRTGSKNNNNSSFDSSPEKEKEKMSTLVKGCTVRIPLSKKAALETEVPDGDPQKMTDYLLDCLFSSEEQAQMTCDGKTPNTKKLSDTVSSCLQVFIRAKYNSDSFNFDKTLFKRFVNGKFYKARTWVRKNRPELVEQGLVRPKLKKNTKKKTDDNVEGGGDENVATKKTGKKNKKKSESHKKHSSNRKAKSHSQPTKHKEQDVKISSRKQSSETDSQGKKVKKTTLKRDSRQRDDERGNNSRRDDERGNSKHRDDERGTGRHGDSGSGNVRHFQKDDGREKSSKITHDNRGEGRNPRDSRKRFSDDQVHHPDQGQKRPKFSVVLEAAKKMNATQPKTSTPKSKKVDHGADDWVTEHNITKHFKSSKSNGDRRVRHFLDTECSSREGSESEISRTSNQLNSDDDSGSESESQSGSGSGSQSGGGSESENESNY